jgi:phosphatidylinositol-3-phosphatase
MNQFQPPRTDTRSPGNRSLPTLLALLVVAGLLVVAVVLFLNRSPGSGAPVVADLPPTLSPVAASPTAAALATATTASRPTAVATPTASMTAVANTRTATPVLSFATIEPLASPTEPPQQATGGIKTVFLIMMENHNWSEIKDSPSAPYINEVLLPQASHAEQYYNPPGIHPSEPNYLWLEAGSNFGIANDANPAANHQSTTNHLVALLDKKGIAWKAYQQGISGNNCPLAGQGLYAPKHNPMIYFDDVTGGNDPNSKYCIAHLRPYSELAGDLQGDGLARYNFITPDLCSDMHNTSGCASENSIKNGDDWLASEVPAILGSRAYKDGGALFITWDEGEGRDGPIGLIVLSPYARGGGYSNSVAYTHSSTLRTVEEIFGLSPMLRDAANANDLSDLFRTFP